MRGRQQMQRQRRASARDRGMLAQPEQFLHADGQRRPAFGLVIQRDRIAGRGLEMGWRLGVEPPQHVPRQQRPQGLAQCLGGNLRESRLVLEMRGEPLRRVRRQQGDVWPDLSDAALAANAAEWLAPHLEDKTALAEVSAETLGDALRALLPWDMLRRLDAEAPTHFEAPTGNSVALDYEAEGGPALAIRVQELFGLREHPSIAGGRAPLTLHLLSPAHRPIQITRDLPGFWKGSWSVVKTEMKGRYPRHVWPDDPANTAPTARAKPRGT